MKQDNRLKKFVGKKLIIIGEDHPWVESVGVGVKFDKVATGDFGLIIKLDGDLRQECFVFDKSEVRLLNPDEVPDLTQEEIIEQLAACNYSPKQIAQYLELDAAAFISKYEDKESDVRHHYDKGRLVAEFEINQKLLENAKSGNITAAQIFEKNRDRVHVENLKQQIFFING